MTVTRKPSLRKLDPEKVIRKDLLNILARVEEGKPLTGPQRAIILQHSGSAGAAPLTSAYAKNIVELASACGVTRQTIHRYAKRKDSPRPAANGQHDIAAWRLFLTKHGAVAGGAADPDKSALEAEALRLRVALMSIDLEERKREVVPMAEHLRKLAAIAETCMRALRVIPDRVAAMTRNPAAVAATRQTCESACAEIRAEAGLADRPAPPVA